MKKQYIVVAVLVLIVIGFLVSKDNTPVSTEKIRIGSVISLTGFASPWGEYARNGINLAVKNINNAGGIDGKMVEVVIEDDQTDGKQAVSAYNKLLSIDKVQGVIGGVFDFTAQPLFPLALSNKLALISPSNFRIAGGFDLNDQSFVMLPDFNKVIRQLKTYVVGEQVKKLAVVHFKSTFGNEIANTLNAVVKEIGNQSDLVNEEYTKIGGNDFRTLIIKLKSQKVDAVFLDMVGDDPLNFLVQSKQLSFKPKFISYNGITDAFANEKDKSLLEGVVVLNWEVSSAKFIDLYKNTYNIEPTKSADKYFDSVYVLAQAISRTSDLSKVSAYLSETKFTTPNGLITFTKEHSAETTPVQINIITGGVQVPYKVK